MAADKLEGPSVVSAAKRIGEDRIVEFALPNYADARKDDLRVDFLAVEEADARVHVLPLFAERAIAVETADLRAVFFLAVARKQPQNLLDVAAPQRTVVA